MVRLLTGMDGEERYDGLLWYRENENSIACHNADSIRRVVDIGCVGAAVQVLCGDAKRISFAEGTVTVTVDPGETVVLAVQEKLTLGLYEDGVMWDALQSGTALVRGTDGKKVYAAYYEKIGDTDKMTALYVCEEGAEISPGDRAYKIKLLAWDGMKPVMLREINRVTETQ